MIVCEEDRRLHVAVEIANSWRDESIRWQHKYGNLRACSLWMVTVLAVLAIVGWLR